MPDKKYSLSIVSYLNTLPFKYGIEQSPVSANIDLHLDIPAVCAQKLKEKKVDIGLVPVALLPEMEEYHIICDYCIGAVGNVDSVKLYSEAPLTEISTVLLDYQSKSSVSLTRVLARNFWNISPRFEPAAEGYEDKIQGRTAAVIIGDRTFSRNGRYSYEYDLAGEWKKFTGLPFVFAAWVSHYKIKDPVFLQQFNEALSYGLHHIDEALAQYHKVVPGFDPLHYLKHKISYPLDTVKKEALAKFLNYLKALH